MRPALFLTLLLATATPCLAAQTPKPGASDPRIRTVAYDADQVVELKAVFDYQLMLEFGADERIENVSIGDGLAWQITPNKRADLLFVKPITAATPTNMTVVTDQHRYVFRLSAQAATGLKPDAITYVVKFIYPAAEATKAPPRPPPTPPARKNIAYTYLGSTAVLPSVVFDDGRFTYFQWSPAVSTPAIFLLGDDGAESLVNYAVRDGYVVVEQVARRFVLRNGQAVTTLINDAWAPPPPEPDAPKPHRDKPAGGRP
ncbi:TrbG/VirB9 family P-type conjugative transfer protein [Caulobacter sp.]|jgi:type IV secretion system protein VirB9|uniref:TrbG/VirB9 family P-type conjugative transfer protein n=1 Tax=Caulobacter sp. TaxID=78 RepID=UPI0025BF6424|nr:TrbG/VirB9 family P-type conjugative transfer protein [Caulobacter sp.]MBQ1562806.1 TrbG/VirB9 family P-type conjugative transfer protein [Caulobacter sp.]